MRRVAQGGGSAALAECAGLSKMSGDKGAPIKETDEPEARPLSWRDRWDDIVMLAPFLLVLLLTVYVAADALPRLFWFPVRLWGFWPVFAGQSIFWVGLVRFWSQVDAIHGLLQGIIAITGALWIFASLLVWLAFIAGCLVGFYG